MFQGTRCSLLLTGFPPVDRFGITVLQYQVKFYLVNLFCAILTSRAEAFSGKRLAIFALAIPWTRLENRNDPRQRPDHVL